MQVFGRGTGEAGVSYLRVGVGASDMNDHVFTYGDIGPGASDPSLAYFTLAEDEADLIPVLKEVLGISPGLRFGLHPGVRHPG